MQKGKFIKYTSVTFAYPQPMNTSPNSLNSYDKRYNKNWYEYGHTFAHKEIERWN